MGVLPDFIKEIMEKSENLGMQTFDGALFKLYEEGRISFEEAIKNADSPNNLRLRIKLQKQDGADNPSKGGSLSALGSLTLEKMPEEEEEETANEQ